MTKLRGHGRSVRVVATFCVLGVLLSALACWGAHRVDGNTEDRLLEVQTRQAAAVLSTAVLLVLQPLGAALDAQGVVGPNGGPAGFKKVMSSNIGTDRTFVSSSMWRRSGDHFESVASIGVPPALSPGSDQLLEILQRAYASSTAVVGQALVEDQSRITYALADPGTGFVVYAERAIPADRRAPVDKNSAYSDLDYAIYLGQGTATEDMTTTDVDLADLPLQGRTSKATVPFGDTVLTIETRSRTHLGSSVGLWLPWLLLVGGLLLTVGAALVAMRLVRAREGAEGDTQTITELYGRVDTLFSEQRELFVRLQRALLPPAIPDVPGMEIGAEYQAGGIGTDIGGDWYSVVAIDDERLAFVVGDVSGHGVDAVAEMARARFTVRAYLIDGHSPAQALENCARQFDVVRDGHIVTVLVGVIHWPTGRVTVANAGHPRPLVVSETAADPVQVPVGQPLGVGPTTYETFDFVLPAGSTLIGFTDGLFERRGEVVDVSLDRLATVLRSVADRPVVSLIADTLAAMHHESASDDIAVLALRRTAL